MKAAIIEGPGNLRLTDLPDPRPTEKEVLLNVHSCGICGTDVQIYQGGFTIPFPMVIGHEFSGEVLKVGKEVKKIRPGDRVTVDPNEVCGECDFCRIKKSNFCTGIVEHGIQVYGGFAEFTLAGEKAVYKLPENVSLEEASFSELLSCALHAINKAQIKLSESVAVFGGGPAGQILLQLAKQAGAGEVHLFTHSDEKLNLGRKLGATEATNPNTVNLKDFKFDLVVEAVGSKKSFEDALKVIAECGRLILFGQANEGEEASVDIFSLLTREISIIPSWLNPYTFSQAIQALKDKKVDVKSLISHKLPLEDIQKGFDLMTKKEKGVMKVVINVAKTDQLINKKEDTQ